MSKTADRVRKLFRGFRNKGSSGQIGPAKKEKPAAEGERQSESGFHVGLSSHVGPRLQNEDYASFSWGGDFYAISDGIGGAPFGDVISRLACNSAIRAFDEGSSIYEAFELANEMASVVSELLGERSGATLLLAERDGSTLRVVSAGDTRGFVLRNGKIKPITDLGRIRENSNMLDKAIGYGPIEPDVAEEGMFVGDRVLLCTDGVWEYLTQRRLVELLATSETAPLAAEAIAWEASRVGQDNSTCVCIFVDEVPEPSTPHLDEYETSTPDAHFTP